MLDSEFSKIWVSIFEKSADKLLLDAFVADLKTAGIAQPDIDKIVDIWGKYRIDDTNLHMDEFEKIRTVLVNKKILFANDELRAKTKLKMMMEKNLICWIIDSYDHIEIKNFMSMILDIIKIEPKHFTDMMCQSLFRLIVSKYRAGEKFGLENIIDFNADDFGIGFVGGESPVTELVDFYTPENRTLNQDFSAMIDYAEKIVQLNCLLEDEVEEKR